MKLMINEDVMTDDEVLRAMRDFFAGSQRFNAVGVIESRNTDDEGDVLVIALNYVGPKLSEWAAWTRQTVASLSLRDVAVVEES